MWIASTLTHQKIKECWVLHLRVLGRSEPYVCLCWNVVFLSISPCFSLIHIDVDQTQHPLVHTFTSEDSEALLWIQEIW